MTVNANCANITLRASLTVSAIKDVSRKKYCDNYQEAICFWDSAVYSIVETDTRNASKIPSSVDIGQISNTIYQRICPKYNRVYTLGNATQYVNIKGNFLRTGELPLDHDSSSPGPVLDIQINCAIQGESKPRTVTKVIRLNILDKNDNYPEKHNGVETYKTTDPNFTKVTEWINECGASFVLGICTTTKLG